MDEQAVASPVFTARGDETVRFATHRFGEVMVARNRVLEFPRGLVGLPHARRFTFLHLDEGAGPFFWLQSLDDPALAFVVCEPQSFFPDYRVPLGREEQTFLGIAEADEGLVCLILVVPRDPQQITANLRGPLVINVERGRGMQLVLAGEEYPARALLFGARAEGGAGCSS